MAINVCSARRRHRLKYVGMASESCRVSISMWPCRWRSGENAQKHRRWHQRRCQLLAASAAALSGAKLALSAGSAASGALAANLRSLASASNNESISGGGQYLLKYQLKVKKAKASRSSVKYVIYRSSSTVWQWYGAGLNRNGEAVGVIENLMSISENDVMKIIINRNEMAA